MPKQQTTDGTTDVQTRPLRHGRSDGLSEGRTDAPSSSWTEQRTYGRTLLVTDGAMDVRTLPHRHGWSDGHMDAPSSSRRERRTYGRTLIVTVSATDVRTHPFPRLLAMEKKYAMNYGISRKDLEKVSVLLRPRVLSFDSSSYRRQKVCKSFRLQL